MYVKLLEALAEMDEQPGQSYVEDLELSVTATDLLGKVVPMRLADRLVWERRYRQAFHLKYSDEPPTDDFGPQTTPLLAFAARCTSSFPLAFEPMQLASIPRLVRASWKRGKQYDVSDAGWERRFAEWQAYFGVVDPSGPDKDRFFADGGYLDNHPFDHALDSMSRQSSAVRAERKLLYIEPSPDHPERETNQGRDAQGRPLQPDAIENAWAALSGIPGKQPIHDSLQQLQQRNRFIRKVNNLVTEIFSVVEESPLTRRSETKSAGSSGRPPATFGPQRTDTPGFRAYQALSLYAVTDDLALRIARGLKIDEDSDFVYAIRCLIKVWRQREFQGNEMQFLMDFDISYRKRRYQFVKSQLQLLSRLSPDAKKRLAKLGLEVSEDSRPEFQREIERLRRVLHGCFLRIRTASRLAAANETLLAKIHGLDLTEDDLMGILGVVDPGSNGLSFAPVSVSDQASCEERAEALLTPQRKAALQELRSAIKAHYGAAIEAARAEVTPALTSSETDSPMRQAVLKIARVYYYGFWEFDAAIFPITYETDAGELFPVDVLRVSPEDAIAIQDESKTGRSKLAGTSFGAFGAFLERVWRTNDILWGRLDGAERIIRALAGPGPQADALIERAHDVIIAEELTPANRQQICKMLLDAVLRDRSATDTGAQRSLDELEQCVRNAAGSSDINPKLLAVLRSALKTDELRKALGSFEISREPNRKDSLRNLARSVRIIGRILDDIGGRKPLLKKPAVLLVQAGSVLWGLVEVATPGSIWGSFFSYWFGLLLLFSAVMIAGGTLFSEPVQSLGFRLLVLAVSTRLAVSVLRNYITGDRWWKRAFLALFVVLLLGLIVLGMIEANQIYGRFEASTLSPHIAAARAWLKHLI